MILESQFVFLDTSIFQAQNFTEGKEINKLFDICNKEGLNILIVDITHRECYKRIEAILTRVKTLYKQANTSFSREGRVLRLLKEYNPYNPLPKIIIEDEFLKICKIFDDFLKKYNVAIIPSSQSSVDDVFNQYFEKKPPFGNGQKKDEFPDAFVLNTIENFCKKRKSLAFLVTQDDDMLTYDSRRIITKNGISDMLNAIVSGKKMYQSLYSEITQLLTDPLVITETELSGYENEFSELLYERIMSDPDYLELEYEPGEIHNFTLNEHTITLLDDTAVEVEIIGFLEIMVPLYYNDLSMATYDKEDGVYYNVTNVVETSTYKMEISFQCLFEFDYDSKVIRNFNLHSIWDFTLLDWEKINESIDEKSEYSDW